MSEVFSHGRRSKCTQAAKGGQFPFITEELLFLFMMIKPIKQKFFTETFCCVMRQKAQVYFDHVNDTWTTINGAVANVIKST